MKQTLIWSLLAPAMLAAAGGTSTLAQTTDSGGMLRDKAGKTIYTFDKDAAGAAASMVAPATGRFSWLARVQLAGDPYKY